MIRRALALLALGSFLGCGPEPDLEELARRPGMPVAELVRIAGPALAIRRVSSGEVELRPLPGGKVVRMEGPEEGRVAYLRATPEGTQSAADAAFGLLETHRPPERETPVLRALRHFASDGGAVSRVSVEFDSKEIKIFVEGHPPALGNHGLYLYGPDGRFREIVPGR